MDKLRFGTAGVPISTTKSSSEEGVKRVRELGLDSMELEFVRGVRFSEEKAEAVKLAAEKNDILLTAHGPYYINLNSNEPEKVRASIERVLNTARACDAAGGYSITFHAAYYLKQDPEKVFNKVQERMKNIVKELKDESINLWVRPEITGKKTQLGSLNELIRLSQNVEHVLPCIDWAHLHSRDNGALKKEEDFDKVFVEIEKGLGKEALTEMHCHVEGIAYGEKGEKNHLNLKDSDFKYKILAKKFKEFNVKGTIISESPNIEQDALLMQKEYHNIK